MKTRIRNRVQAGQNPRDLGRLAKSARFVGLLDDAEVETDIDTQMTAAIPSASVDELVEMSEGIAELRGGSADMGQVATADNLTEGGNKFLKAANVQSEISVAGDLSYDNGVVSYTAPTAAALQVVATVGDLPLDATAGTQAVVTANNNLYIRTADGWYAVALINTAPTVSGNDASYTLATDETPTVITLTATDPENDPVTFSHSVSSGDLNGTTVTQNDNVFTVTPHASNPATFDLTFSADDSVNVATTTPSSFSLNFAPDFSGHYLEDSANGSYYFWDDAEGISSFDEYEAIADKNNSGKAIRALLINPRTSPNTGVVVNLGTVATLKGFVTLAHWTSPSNNGSNGFGGLDWIKVFNVDTNQWEAVADPYPTNSGSGTYWDLNGQKYGAASLFTAGHTPSPPSPISPYNPTGAYNTPNWDYGEAGVRISKIQILAQEKHNGMSISTSTYAQCPRGIFPIFG